MRSATVPQAWLACCATPSARTASSRGAASAASAARAARSASEAWRQGSGERLGGAAVRGLGGLQRVQRLGPACGDLGGAASRVVSAASASACRAARSVTRSAASRARSAQPARSAIDRAAAVGPAACSRASMSRSARAAASRERAADSVARAVDRGAQCGDVGQGGLGCPRLRQGGHGLVALRGEPGQSARPPQPAGRRRWRPGCAGGQGGAGAFERLLPVAARGAGLLFGRGGRLRGGFGRRAGGARRRGFLLRLGQACASAVSRLRCCSRTAAGVGVPARMV